MSDFTVVETLVAVSFFDVRVLSLLLVVIGFARLGESTFAVDSFMSLFGGVVLLGVLLEVTLVVSLGCVFGSSNFIPFDF